MEPNRNNDGKNRLTSDEMLEAAARLVEPDFTLQNLSLEILRQMKEEFGREFMGTVIGNWFDQHDRTTL